MSKKYKPSGEDTSVRMAPLDFPRKVLEKANPLEGNMTSNFSVEADVDIDLREVYFLIMHFLSTGPCKRTFGQFWNELLEHQLLPRRYHAWYSRSGLSSGNEDDDGTSLPLGYLNLTERYPHIEKDHLIRLLKQLILSCSTKSPGSGGGPPNAADVPTLLGSGLFSLLGSERDMDDNDTNKLPGYQRWPHMHADQVRGLSLRELGGGFTKHHRAPSVRAACYAIAKPSTLVQKMEIIKKLRGHQNSVYCATFDRSGRYVITGSDDRLVKIWSMETAFCLASCRGHEGDITDLAVSSNNALVASSSNDFIIRVWRLPDGMQISVLRGHIGSVTAIAFSPRPSAVYQLLSSSDDGTCRIWDARNSNLKPRIYIPKPPDIVAGKNTDPSPNSSQRSHHILCCAFNANGTVFVTGSSDNFARVWNACKGNPDDSEQPNIEMDVLAGHENDVNYVQFSGCAVPSRSSVSDSLREDNLPKFKNSWFTHDNIVTCSRDGSAIIWVPRSRRSHGKVGRWTRAYHLKVPPPPMPPQPPRGGPRQRYQQTPRGVNMIIWSLDNRFVLAAIMDCRICVWNSSDGSLVHSLNGHQESTFVLDVHPFNPRIAMSAGYDGKMIIWDIWEGKPVRIYETGNFKLVDGKFSPDGTSIILSDEVGQIYIVTTGEGESQKDAKYDQFFLGDYRPLMQDTHGNALDQETQLTPYRRNIQDLLCDSSMIPYSEPYQNMYQRRRLGIMGLEWRPTSLNFAIGPTYNVNIGDFQPLPIVDLEQWVEPLPEIVDAVDWEQENEIQTDDTDSEYNVTDEFPSEGEQESLGNSSCGEAECSGEDGGIDHENNEGLRRSKRKNSKFEVEITTSSGRRVKRRNLDDHDGMGMSRAKKPSRLRNGRIKKRKKLSESKSSRPQRVAARNARNLLCKITGGTTEGEDDESEGGSCESDSDVPDSMVQCVDSERSMDSNLIKHSTEKEPARDGCEGVPESSPIVQSQANPGGSRKLILKFSRPRSKPVVSSECEGPDNHGSMVHLQHLANSSAANQPASGGPTDETREQTDKCYRPTYFIDRQATNIKWGEVKMRSSKRLKSSDMFTGPYPDGPSIIRSDTNESSKFENEHQINFSRSIGLDDVSQNLNGKTIPMPSPERNFRPSGPPLHPNDHQDQVETLGSFELADEAHCHHPMNFELEDILEPPRGPEIFQDGRNEDNNARVAPIVDSMKVSPLKIKIKSKGLGNEASCSSSRFNSVAIGGQRSADYEIVSNSSAPYGQVIVSVANEEDETTNGSGNLDSSTSGNAGPSSSHDATMVLDSNVKMYSSVYKRSKSSRDKKNFSVIKEEDKSPSNNHHGGEMEVNLINASTRRTRRLKSAVPHEISPSMSSYAEKQRYGFRDKGKSVLNIQDEHLCNEWKSPSKLTVGLRSARNRRENYSSGDLRNFDKGKNHHSVRKFSWLMLLEHEASCRYIPQKGDEVAYLRQGHLQYNRNVGNTEPMPWQSIEGHIKAVEFCKVRELEYCTVPGSGDSGCKLLLEFIDPSSDVFGKSFQVTFLELVSDPDFLVERTRYESSIERNWTRRDKCQVWWRNPDGNGGSWWEGRVIALINKSADFPESPWESYQIKYKDDSCPQMHSPWELYDDPHWEHPHLDDEIRKYLLDSILKIEEDSTKNKDYHGIQKLNQVAQKSDFLNRYPVPLSFEVIKMRLINYYYRTREAIDHDVKVMLSNAKSYFSKNAEMRTKMHRLSEWFAKLFDEL